MPPAKGYSRVYVVVKENAPVAHALFPWFVMVCALLFSAGIVVFGLHNAKRESDFTSQLTLEKGAALISALEGALRTGMGYHWSDEVLSDLLNKVGEQPDIVSLVITNRNGTVLMAADTKLIGTSFLSPEVLAELDPTRQVKWNATELPDGMPVFQVYKQFSVPQGERRRHGGGHRMMRRGLDGDSCGMLEASIAEGTSLVIFVEYDLTPLEEAQAADEKHMAVMFGILVFVGLVGLHYPVPDPRVTGARASSYRKPRPFLRNPADASGGHHFHGHGRSHYIHQPRRAGHHRADPDGGDGAGPS